ncbi:MAG: response regulator transcription factor [Rhodospirillaceae bacterium]|nr:response regulator transcription factor [Rhodospirillaceae bacterium]
MKVLIVDDHAIVRAGLKRLLAALPNAVIREAATGRDALALYREERADIVLLDINLPGIGGLELLGRILLLDKTARVLMFSMHTEAVYAGRALQAGALGYVSKNAAPDEVLNAIRKVADGGRYIENEIAQELALQPASGGDPLKQLTERDLEILRLLGEGRSLAEIAEALGVGYKTVANTSSQIKAKLGVTRTADLIRLSIEMGVAR